MLPVLRNGSLVPTTSTAPVNRLSSLFDRFFSDDFFAPLASAGAWTALPLAMWEDEHNVYIEVDAPGLTEKDVDLCVHQGELVIRGERKCERQEGGYDTRRYGQLEQRVSLPSAVDADKVEARLANGVLKIMLPRSPEARPRKIDIKTV